MVAGVQTTDQLPGDLALGAENPRPLAQQVAVLVNADFHDAAGLPKMQDFPTNRLGRAFGGDPRADGSTGNFGHRNIRRSRLGGSNV